jgi:hypothetical protein
MNVFSAINAALRRVLTCTNAGYVLLCRSYTECVVNVSPVMTLVVFACSSSQAFQVWGVIGSTDCSIALDICCARQ